MRPTMLLHSQSMVMTACGAGAPPACLHGALLRIQRAGKRLEQALGNGIF